MISAPSGDEISGAIRQFFAIVFGITVVGTTGFMLLEEWEALDALYMTVITLSTVGFGEVASLSTGGRIFTIILITAGVGAVAYLFSTLSHYVVSGALTGSFRSRRMQRTIDQLANHFIVCGFGRVGQHVVDDLESRGQHCVIIESDKQVLDILADAGRPEGVGSP